jgi:uncharacterized protein (TIGR03382 family)
VPDDQGNCVLDNTTATCGANSHLEGGNCVCDECFQAQPASPGDETNFACVAVPSCVVCTDPLQSSESGVCTCETGTQADSTGACQPVVGNCGSETFAGRCDGAVLVYCDDTNPAQEVITTIDCSQNPDTTVCDLDPTGGGFNCIAPVSNCGSVTDTGTCVGSTAEICEGGVLTSVDCGSAGCGPVDYSGTTYQYCLADQSSGTTSGTTGTSSGNTTGTSGGTGTTGGTTGGTSSGSTSSGSTSGSTGSSSGSGSSGGCSSSGDASGLLALLGLALAGVRRRR